MTQAESSGMSDKAVRSSTSATSGASTATSSADSRVGDGTLATAALHKLPVKIVVLNNHYLGMVRQWQELFYEDRESGVDLVGNPDFCKLAEAYGMLGLRAETKPEVGRAIRAARQHEGPVLVDFRVEAEVNVFPMVQPGRALHDMMRRPKADMVFAAK